MPLGSFPYIDIRAEIYKGLFLGQTVNSIALYMHSANRLCVATFPNTRFGTNIIRGVFMIHLPFSLPWHLFSVNICTSPYTIIIHLLLPLFLVKSLSPGNLSHHNPMDPLPWITPILRSGFWVPASRGCGHRWEHSPVIASICHSALLRARFYFFLFAFLFLPHLSFFSLVFSSNVLFKEE